MFPIVTGNKFFHKKLTQFKDAGSKAAGAGTPAQLCRKIPAGIKYILAMQCSNPMATNAMMGK